MTDIKKQFEEAIDLDTIDMYMEYEQKRDEHFKCFLWNFSDDFFRNIMAPILALNDIVPKKNIYKMKHKHTWFFYCEPEWYWGKEGNYRVNQ